MQKYLKTPYSNNKTHLYSSIFEIEVRIKQLSIIHNRNVISDWWWRAVAGGNSGPYIRVGSCGLPEAGFQKINQKWSIIIFCKSNVASAGYYSLRCNRENALLCNNA